MVKWRTFALIATFFAVLLSLVLIYQLIYLKRVRDHVVDFLEQSLLQQFSG